MRCFVFKTITHLLNKFNSLWYTTPMKIYLMRHGQDEDNSNGLLNGHRDTPLTDVGIQQADTAANRIKDLGLKFDVIYASPLQRAFTTAEIVSELTDNPKPVSYKYLIERDFGYMAGKKVEDIERLCSPDVIKTDTITYFINADGAETFPEMIERAEILVEEMYRKHEHDTLLFVSHGDFGKMVYAAFYELPWLNVLKDFHFGNSELLLLSKDIKPEDSRVFEAKQYNL